MNIITAVKPTQNEAYESFYQKAVDLKVNKLFRENLPLIILYATLTVCTLFVAAPILIELVGGWYKVSGEEVESTVRKAESVFIEAKQAKKFPSEMAFTDMLFPAEKRLKNMSNPDFLESLFVNFHDLHMEFIYDTIGCKRSEALKCIERTGLLVPNLDSEDEPYLDLTIEEYLSCVRLLGKHLSELEKNLLTNRKEFDAYLSDLYKIDMTGINANETLRENIKNPQVKKLREIGHMLQSDYKHSKRILAVMDIFARDKQNSLNYAPSSNQIPKIFDLLSSAPASHDSF